MNIKQNFTCSICNKHEIYPYEAQPKHCNQPMTPGEPIFPNDNKTETKLHMIILKRKPEIDWQLPTEPDQIFEVWKLKPGRANGERLGWLAKRSLSWEWKMPTGIGTAPGGLSATAEHAVQSMLLALDGGLAAKQVIAKLAEY